MMLFHYTLTPTHNSQTQYRRGLLCGYAVMPAVRVCVHAGAQVGACAWACACMRVCRVTVQPCNSLGVARVSQLHARATA